MIGRLVIAGVLVLAMTVGAGAFMGRRNLGGVTPSGGGGLTNQTTMTNSCAGNLCTPAAASCAVFTNGLLTGFSTGAC